MKMAWYKLKARFNRTARASSRYGHKVFRKGETYSVRRKLSPSAVRSIRRNGEKVFGFKLLSARKIRK
jgi:hypothetical protein